MSQVVYVVRECHIVVEDKHLVELHKRQCANLTKSETMVLVCPNWRPDEGAGRHVDAVFQQRCLLLLITLWPDDDVDRQARSHPPCRAHKPKDPLIFTVIRSMWPVLKFATHKSTVKGEEEEDGYSIWEARATITAIRDLGGYL